MKLEELITVEYILYKTFKDKINITKEYRGKAKLKMMFNTCN